MRKNSETSNGSVQAARPDQAPFVHTLLFEAFADGLLPYTIYRTPQSVARLEELAEEGRIHLVGAEGVSILSDDHLDYLAVARRARGRGIGRSLLEEFHRDRRRSTLDVTAENPARALYERMGYVVERETVAARLGLDGRGEVPETWRAALREEAARGFSAVGHAGMRIGLLNGTALRLLDPGGRTVEEALAILSLIGYAGRKEMILTGLRAFPEGYRRIHETRNLRMVRETR